jgi:hypothetical protein
LYEEDVMRNPHDISSPIRMLGAATIAVTAAAAFFAGGCGSRTEHAQLVSEKQYLARENRRVSDALEAKNVETRELEVALVEVQNGLEEIRGRELAAIRTSIRVVKEGRAAATLREELRTEVRTIRDAVHENLAKLARLEAQSAENGLRTKTLETLTGELRRSLTEKDTLVKELEGRVRDLSLAVKTQAASLNEKDSALRDGEARLARKTKEANTAWVAVASKSALAQKGVVARAGLGAWTQTGRFDPNLFREVDVTRDLLVEIPAPAKSIRVVTAQPKESYRIVEADAKTSKLEVADAEAFWRGERYLVVMLPD